MQVKEGKFFKKRFYISYLYPHQYKIFQTNHFSTTTLLPFCPEFNRTMIQLLWSQLPYYSLYDIQSSNLKNKKSFNLKSLRRYILCTINNSHTILQDSMVCMIRKCWNIHFMEPSMTRLNCKKHDKLFKYLHATQIQLFVYSAISRYFTLCQLHLATEIAHILIVFSILSLPLSRQNHVSYHRCSLRTSWEAQAHELHFCGRRNSTD